MKKVCNISVQFGPSDFQVLVKFKENTLKMFRSWVHIIKKRAINMA